MASKPAKAGLILYNNEAIRIVLVGKTGAGKSATGNTILGRECFESEFSSKSVTADCAKAYGHVDGQKVAVIDTPGLFDTNTDEEKTSKDVGMSISYASPGPHIFLVVIKLGRFTEEEKKTVEKIQQIFGQDADKYSMVLFTHGDQLKRKTIEEFLEDSKDLQELVAKCNGQCHVFNNELEDRSQVSELLKKINNITEKNGGKHYTNEMFQKAERAIEEEKQRILKEKAEQIRKEREEMERKISEKYEQEMRKMKADMEREEKERKRKEKQEEELRKEKADKEREKMERKMKEKLEELQKMKADMEREKMERRMREEHDQEMRQMKADMERVEMERRMREEHEQKLWQMKADMERVDQLRAARERELEEENRKLREEQEQAARQEAENSCSVLKQIGDILVGVLRVVVEAAPTVIQVLKLLKM